MRSAFVSALWTNFPTYSSKRHWSSIPAIFFRILIKEGRNVFLKATTILVADFSSGNFSLLLYFIDAVSLDFMVGVCILLIHVSLCRSNPKDYLENHGCKRPYFVSLEVSSSGLLLKWSIIWLLLPVFTSIVVWSCANLKSRGSETLIWERLEKLGVF